MDGVSGLRSRRRVENGVRGVWHATGATVCVFILFTSIVAWSAHSGQGDLISSGYGITLAGAGGTDPTWTQTDWKGGRDPRELLPGEYTLGLWHFDEGTGSTVRDSTAYRNNGTIGGTENTNWKWWVDNGRFDSALHVMDGTGKVTVPNSSSLSPSGGFDNLTVEFWYYDQDVSAANEIVGKFDWEENGWLVKDDGQATDSNKFKLYVWMGFGPGNGAYGWVIDNAGRAGEWVHIAAVYAPYGSGHKMTVYANGVEIDSASNDAWGNIASANNSLIIGNGNGVIDEVRIENRALTAEEIAGDATWIRSGTWSDTYSRYHQGENVGTYLSPSKVTIENYEEGGYQLLVDNSPFLIRGFNYAPTPVGWDPRVQGQVWCFDENTYKDDLPVIENMGANTLLIHEGERVTKEFMDAAYEHGLRVILTYNLRVDENLADNRVQENHVRQFVRMVNTWKDHPAVLMWCFGSELDSFYQGDLSDFYDLLNDAAGAAHAAEGENYHPVMTKVAWMNDTTNCSIGDASKGADDSSLPNLDVWGVDAYLGPTFGNLFENLAARTSKPLVMAEFGCDALDARDNTVNEAMQASYLENQWGEIYDNCGRDNNTSGQWLGGTVFEWSDEWWKSYSSPSDNGPGKHDNTAGWNQENYYDYQAGANNMNEEWWGVVGIGENTYGREYREAFTTLKDLWTTLAGENLYENERWDADEGMTLERGVYRRAPVTESTQALWRMDEGEGSTIYDETGDSNNEGTINGATWVPGKFGNALKFDNDDWVEISSPATLDNENFTVEAWVYLRSYPTGAGGDLSKTIIAKGGEDNVGYYGMFINDNKTVSAKVHTENAPYQVDGSTKLELNRWYHVAMTFDERWLKLFVDGQLDGSIRVEGRKPSNDMSLTLGKVANSTYLVYTERGFVYPSGILTWGGAEVDEITYVDAVEGVKCFSSTAGSDDGWGVFLGEFTTTNEVMEKHATDISGYDTLKFWVRSDEDQLKIELEDINGTKSTTIYIGGAGDEYGYTASGEWEFIKIPRSDFGTDIDYTKVYGVFLITGSSGGTYRYIDWVRWVDEDDNNYFDGRIDDVRIENRALSEDEVEARAGYKPSAYLESSVFDAGGSVDWGTITWNASTPSGTVGDNYLVSAEPGTLADGTTENGTVVGGSITDVKTLNGENEKIVEESVAPDNDVVTNGNFDTDNSGWNYSEEDALGFADVAYNASGWENFTYVDDSPTTGIDDVAYQWLYQSFTAPSGTYVSITSSIAWQNTSTDLANCTYTVRVKIDNSTENLTVYDSGAQSTTASWSTYENVNVPTSFFTPGNTYKIWVEHVVDQTGNGNANKVDVTTSVDNIKLIFHLADYRLNWEHRITGIDNTYDNYKVRVYGYREGTETIEVFIRNVNTSSWELMGNLQADTPGWIEYHLTSENVNNYLQGGENICIRYFENTGDTTQDNIYIDYCAVEATEYATTSITVKTRTGTDNNPRDGGWNDWAQQSSGTAITSPDNRYIQYRVELSTTHPTLTPTLHEITISYSSLGVVVDMEIDNLPKWTNISKGATDQIADTDNGNPMRIIIKSTTTVRTYAQVKGSDNLEKTTGTYDYIGIDNVGMNNGTTSYRDNGTLYGSVSWTTGKLDNGLSFPGTSGSYVSVPHSSELAPSGGLPNLSVEMWIYPESFSSGQPRLLIKRGDSWPPTNGWDIYLENVGSGENLENLDLVVVIKPSSGDYWGVSARDNIVVGQWSHIAVTYNGSNGQIIIYINGTEVAYETWNSGGSGNIVSDNENALYIGRYTTDLADRYFKGKIDEIRIENRVLSASEISDDYNSGSGSKLEVDDNTLAVWHFDEERGSTCYDGGPIIKLSTGYQDIPWLDNIAVPAGSDNVQNVYMFLSTRSDQMAGTYTGTIYVKLVSQT